MSDNSEYVHGNFEYLTRSDIANILKISPKQAGRLMSEMPILKIGKIHRRVALADFEAWCLERRVMPLDNLPALGSKQLAPPDPQRLRSVATMPSKGTLIDAAREKTGKCRP